MKIYVIGSLNCDYSVVCDTPPMEGETVLGGDFSICPGGKGSNQAIAAARLGGDVLFCGKIGNDNGGRMLENLLSESGVDVTNVTASPTLPTGSAIIIVSNGNNRIIVAPGANSSLCKGDVDRFLAGANKGDILMAQLENPIDTVGYALKVGKEKGMTVCLNPAPADERIKQYLEYVDILTPNESELALLGGKEELLEKGVKTVITTLGGEGYEISSTSSSQKFPCIKVKAVDTTAAGDTFCGGLAAALSKGESIENAAIFASKAASISVTRRGASSSIPSEKEVILYK